MSDRVQTTLKFVRIACLAFVVASLAPGLCILIADWIG